MNFRTDLALERCEILGKNASSGIETKTFEAHKARITRIDVTDIEGEKLIGKPVGRYVTVEVDPFAEHSQFIDGSLSALTEEVRAIIPKSGSVLVVGLGNSKITADALGPKCASMIFATRHIKGELLKATGLGNLRSVSVVTPGVMGETGAEASEIIKGVVQVLMPDAVITVDALAARSTERLGRTVQMCNTGIVPGSGVGNARQEISKRTVGVPVISIGVPTVIDAAAFVTDFNVDEGDASKSARGMMVTPKEVDLMIERASKLTALAINCALQPGISPEDMLILTA